MIFIKSIYSINIINKIFKEVDNQEVISFMDSLYLDGTEDNYYITLKMFCERYSIDLLRARQLIRSNDNIFRFECITVSNKKEARIRLPFSDLEYDFICNKLGIVNSKYKTTVLSPLAVIILMYHFNILSPIYLYLNDEIKEQYLSNTVKIGYVYIIKNTDNGLSKIGCSVNPNKRINSIRTLSGLGNKLINTHLFSSIEYKILEKQFHLELNNKRMIGEWFNITDNDIDNALKKIKIPTISVQSKF